MVRYVGNLLNMELTILILSTLAIIIKLVLWFLKYRSRSASAKLTELLALQPYKIAIIIILSYFIANDIAIPVVNLSAIIPNGTIITVWHALQVLRVSLIIILIYKQEQAIYFWVTQATAWSNTFILLILGIRNSLRVCIFSILLPFLLPEFIFSTKIERIVHILTTIFIIWSVTWVIIQLIYAGEKIYLKNHLNFTLADYRLRSIITQGRIFRKIITIIIIIIAIAATCFIFESARAIGTSILASAGIATGILGFAANKIIGNFFAGIQVALTKPIKINDLVMIADEFGTVEDITLNYAVIRIWDLRCLIVPINYFMERSFYNYSLNSTTITSVIIFFADYSLPVNEIREYFMQIVTNSKFWDHKTASLQVIDFQDNTIKLRGTASTINPTNAWNLKCEVIEKLAELFAAKYPDYLPKFRLEDPK